MTEKDIIFHLNHIAAESGIVGLRLSIEMREGSRECGAFVTPEDIKLPLIAGFGNTFEEAITVLRKKMAKNANPQQPHANSSPPARNP